MPTLVYVPDEATGTVIVIDPSTDRILRRYSVGSTPEHITPDWSLGRLFVNATFGERLAVIDPETGRLGGSIPVEYPYNLYFSLDGQLALDIVDRRLASLPQVYIYDRATWRLRKAITIPGAGANHLDLSADGRSAYLSTEYSGDLVQIDLAHLKVVSELHLGGSPVDVMLAPDGRLLYVSNQILNGVTLVDPATMRRVGFIRTGRGAHGLAMSRDARWVYVTNRYAGTLSVIDVGTRRVVHTWKIGGSPDMISVSADGTQLWISNRFSGSVSVVDTATGRLIHLIRTGGRPHGLVFFPAPGRFSLGHNGIYR